VRIDRDEPEPSDVVGKKYLADQAAILLIRPGNNPSGRRRSPSQQGRARDALEPDED